MSPCSVVVHVMRFNEALWLVAPIHLNETSIKIPLIQAQSNMICLFLKGKIAVMSFELLSTVVILGAYMNMRLMTQVLTLFFVVS